MDTWKIVNRDQRAARCWCFDHPFWHSSLDKLAWKNDVPEKSHRFYGPFYDLVLTTRKIFEKNHQQIFSSPDPRYVTQFTNWYYYCIVFKRSLSFVMDRILLSRISQIYHWRYCRTFWNFLITETKGRTRAILKTEFWNIWILFLFHRLRQFVWLYVPASFYYIGNTNDDDRQTETTTIHKQKLLRSINRYVIRYCMKNDMIRTLT